jgi:hypothetical protein
LYRPVKAAGYRGTPGWIQASFSALSVFSYRHCFCCLSPSFTSQIQRFDSNTFIIQCALRCLLFPALPVSLA